MRGTTNLQVTMLSTLTSDSLIPATTRSGASSRWWRRSWRIWSRSSTPCTPPRPAQRAPGAAAQGDGADGPVLDPQRAAVLRAAEVRLLFKFFLDLNVDAEGFDHSTFSKNRERLLKQEIADRFFAVVVKQAHLRRYISGEHFSVDGTLLEPGPRTRASGPRMTGTRGVPQRGTEPGGRLPRGATEQRDPPVDHRP